MIVDWIRAGKDAVRAVRRVQVRSKVGMCLGNPGVEYRHPNAAAARQPPPLTRSKRFEGADPRESVRHTSAASGTRGSVRR